MKIKHFIFLIIVAIICLVNIITTSDLMVGIVNSIVLLAIAFLFFVLIRYPEEEYMVESTIKLKEKKDVSAIQD